MRKQGTARIPHMTRAQDRRLYAKNAVAVPDLGKVTEPDDLDKFNYFGIMAGLSVNQMTVLKAIVGNVMSETKRTDAQIARDCGLSITTVCTYRNNPTFSLALAAAINGVLRGKFDIWVNEIESICRSKKDWRGFEFLLKLAGLFIPQSQQLNVNVDGNVAETGNFRSPHEAFETVVIRMAELGYTKDDLNETWDRLKSQGAW